MEETKFGEIETKFDFVKAVELSKAGYKIKKQNRKYPFLWGNSETIFCSIPCEGTRVEYELKYEDIISQDWRIYWELEKCTCGGEGIILYNLPADCMLIYCSKCGLSISSGFQEVITGISLSEWNSKKCEQEYICKDVIREYIVRKFMFYYVKNGWLVNHIPQLEPDEYRTEVKAFKTSYRCPACDKGEMVLVEGSILLHECNNVNCDYSKVLDKKYPSIEYVETE